MLQRVLTTAKTRCPVKNRSSSLSLRATSHWLLVTAFLLVASWSHAQVVDIPDPTLRAAVMERLQLTAPPTQADMLRLTDLRKHWAEIESLRGLEHAVNLTRLNLEGHPISDITPLADLRNLEWLKLPWNAIKDISPLAGLTNLQYLEIDHNLITDFGPLAGLANLRHLIIHNNYTVDHAALDNLALDTFIYDQICDMPPLPLEPRLKNRSFPSIFASFNTVIVNKWDELLEAYGADWFAAKIAEAAYHDIVFFAGPLFGEQDKKGDGIRQIHGEWHIASDMPYALDLRERFLALNPNLIFLQELLYHSTGDFELFPEDSPYWLRYPSGEIVTEGRRLINFAHPDVQDMIVERALAIARCGLYDGVFFDHWNDETPDWGEPMPREEAVRARLNIARRIREAARPDFLIMGNTNDFIIPLTGPFVNAAWMESIVPEPGVPREPSIRVVRESLEWLETNLREPRLILLQGGTDPSEPPDSPYNRRLMRATTTMSLTHSDGYVQFGIDSSDDKWWYDFWDVDLGQPVGPKFQFYESIEGLYIREFTNGWAVYNQSGQARVIELPQEVQSVASGLPGTEHAVAHIDGDIFLKIEPRNPADVNGDGIVNILDLILVAQGLGTDDLTADVNGDGVVNVFDLVFVADQF